MEDIFTNIVYSNFHLTSTTGDLKIAKAVNREHSMFTELTGIGATSDNIAYQANRQMRTLLKIKKVFVLAVEGEVDAGVCVSSPAQ